MVKTRLSKIGIIGVGYVGGAVRQWFKKHHQPGVQLYLYDKYKKIGSVEEVNNADVIFICVPTPYHKGVGYDDSAVTDVLKMIQGKKVVVIKSTILPGSTEKFQKKFPRHKILFNPEFLVQKTAIQGFIKPDRQIIGYTKKSKQWAKKVLPLLPRAPYTKTMPATEAEFVKLFGNAFLSTRVIFANQVYDLCKALGADYDTVKDAAGADARIGTSHFDIFQDNYRGYGGACLPKDTKALIDFAEKLKVKIDLISAVDRINKRLRRRGN